MENMKPIAVVAGARTPFAKAFTDLRSLSAVQLGQHARWWTLCGAVDLPPAILTKSSWAMSLGSPMRQTWPA